MVVVDVVESVRLMQFDEPNQISRRRGVVDEVANQVLPVKWWQLREKPRRLDTVDFDAVRGAVGSILDIPLRIPAHNLVLDTADVINQRVGSRFDFQQRDARLAQPPFYFERDQIGQAVFARYGPTRVLTPPACLGNTHLQQQQEAAFVATGVASMSESVCVQGVAIRSFLAPAEKRRSGRHTHLGTQSAASLTKSLWVFVVLALASALRPANALDLYDAARDKQAQQAKAATAAIDTTAVITALQANHKALLAAELSTQDAYAATRRNLVLRELVGSSLRDTKNRRGLLDLIEREEKDLSGVSDPETGGVDGKGPVGDALKALGDWQSATKLFESSVDALSSDFQRLGLGTPGCDGIGVVGDPPPPIFKRQIQAGGAIDPVDVTNVLQNIRMACHDRPPAHFDASRFRGAWGIAYANLLAIEKALAALKEVAARDQRDYQNALDEYNKAVSANAAAGAPQAQQAVDDAAKKLTNIVNVIGTGENAFSTQFIAQEKLTSLHDFLTEVMQAEEAAATPAAPAASASPSGTASAASPAASGAASPGAAPAAASAAASSAPKSKAALLVVGLSKLDDDTRKALAQAKIPLNVPLMLARDQEQLKLSAANVDVAAWQTQLDLARQTLTAITDELRQLWNAHKDLSFETKDVASAGSGNSSRKATAKQPRDGKRSDDASASADPPIHMGRLASMRYDLALAAATPDEKNYLLTATVKYLDAVNRFSALREKLDRRRIAAGYDRSLAYSAVNVQRWQSLISVTTDQVADFYAAGFKPETIANLVHAASLLWIGIGVNK